MQGRFGPQMVAPFKRLSPIGFLFGLLSSFPRTSASPAVQFRFLTFSKVSCGPGVVLNSALIGQLPWHVRSELATTPGGRWQPADEASIIVVPRGSRKNCFTLLELVCHVCYARAGALEWSAALVCLPAACLPLPAAGCRLATLSPKEISDGWLLLFDGETTFGWEPNSLMRTSGRQTEGGACAAM